MSGRPGGLDMPWATSMRNPSTPRSSQNRSVFSRSSKISGFSQFRSGCSASNRCRYHWPGLPSGSSTRVQAGPPNTDTQLFGGCRPPWAASVAEDVALALRAAGACRQRGLEPGMPRTGVVGHQIHRDLDAAGVRRLDQPVQRADAAEQRVDVAGVGDVVAVVGHRGHHHRVQPERVDAEAAQIVEAGRSHRRDRRRRHRCCRGRTADTPGRRRRGTTTPWGSWSRPPILPQLRTAS